MFTNSKFLNLYDEGTILNPKDINITFNDRLQIDKFCALCKGGICSLSFRATLTGIIVDGETICDYAKDIFTFNDIVCVYSNWQDPQGKYHYTYISNQGAQNKLISNDIIGDGPYDEKYGVLEVRIMWIWNYQGPTPQKPIEEPRYTHLVRFEYENKERIEGMIVIKNEIDTKFRLTTLLSYLKTRDKDEWIPIKDGINLLNDCKVLYVKYDFDNKGLIFKDEKERLIYNNNPIILDVIDDIVIKE